ncbi:neurotrypsin-like isoform X2 [Dreissena polymorpha]|uniref:neurotrypsin-like isoform X2 n=1 Tax=Dreissena polymorpha TaxID=45954 RepID=UPI002264F933|nr:neurotrypsin-like isoform X2 [Dreissena polymorpha]
MKIFSDIIMADLADNCVAKGNIRLCNGSNSSSGRVEVLINGQWGTVCDDSWNEACAQVTCRMFGFTNGSGVSQAYFGPGFGQILMDDTLCSGNETSLFDVTYTSTHNCNHQEDSGVNCFDN